MVTWIRFSRLMAEYSLAIAACVVVGAVARAEEKELRSFNLQELSNVYFSEGANAGDIDGDGKLDIVYGPYWFSGPDFTEKHEIYTPKPQDVNKYSNNNFFNWF